MPNKNIREIVASVATKPAPLSAVEELFQSLWKQLGDAVDAKWRGAYWLSDMSKDVVLLRKRSPSPNALQPVVVDVSDDIYYQAKWKFVKGEIEFDGNPVEVRRVVTYI